MEMLKLDWWGSRLPMILQTEAAECGLACLAMILTYQGHHTDLANLRRRFGMSLKGATLKDLVRVASLTGLAARPVRIDLNELQLLKVPCILHWDLNHFVVLKGVQRNQATIHDPGVGVCKLSMAEISRHFTGVAMELTPIGSFEPARKKPSIRLRSLIGHMVGLKRALGQLFLLAFAMELFAVVSPLFMQWVVDHALLTSDNNLLLTLVLGFSLLLIIRTVVFAMRGWLLIAMGASLNVQGHSNLFSHLLRLPVTYFESRHLGDVMSRFSSQEVILHAITTNVVEAILDGLLVTLTLVVMFIYAPIMSGVVVAGALIYGLFRWASYAPLRQASAEAIVWSARRDSHFLETLRGITAIKLFNGQQERRGRWLNLLVEALNRQLTTQKLQLIFQIGDFLLKGSLAILVVWLGAKSILNNTFSIGMLFAFIAYKDQFLERISTLIDRVLELQMLSLHSERLADIVLTSPEPHDEIIHTEESSNQLPVSIMVRNLSFRYSENDPWVLKDLSFNIRAGESVAIVGNSGCGKTTLLKLLASLLQPVEGEILINEQPISHIGMEHYRSMLGVVMQDDELFTGSIAENISFFTEHPDFQRIEECAKHAAVYDDIIAMPMGFGTFIGDMGSVLSGGQKQRVLIARALYRQPGILLLDEATSHLDVERESAVNAAVCNSGMTRIIIAHRPETIRSADRVIKIEKAKLAAEYKEHPAASAQPEDGDYDIETVLPKLPVSVISLGTAFSTEPKIFSVPILQKKMRICVACEDEILRQGLIKLLTESGVKVIKSIPLEQEELNLLAQNEMDALLVVLDEDVDQRVQDIYDFISDFELPVLLDESSSIKQQLHQGKQHFAHKLIHRLISLLPEKRVGIDS